VIALDVAGDGMRESLSAAMEMTLSMARDDVAKGIRCNYLCPVRIQTAFLMALEKGHPDEKEQMFATVAVPTDRPHDKAR
jgi:NAD(P)-dependent dehydrogenase (short-subunit alcohol dehydrogenase family)